MRIVVIEDESGIRDSICRTLKEKGYDVIALSSARETREYFRSVQSLADLVILDVSLGDGNGFFLMEDGTISGKTPIVFLTVRDDEEDVLKGFSLGADDYIRKPFSMRELLARVERILSKSEEHHVVRSGDVCIDISKNMVTQNGREVILSPIERRLIMVLAGNKGRIISREIFLDYIWEWTGNDVDDHTLTVYMNRLKSKIGDGVFETIRGTGYRLVEN